MGGESVKATASVTRFHSSGLRFQVTKAQAFDARQPGHKGRLLT